MSMRDFISKLDREGKLVHVDAEVDPKFEISSILRRLDDFVRLGPVGMAAGLVLHESAKSTILYATPEVFYINVHCRHFTPRTHKERNTLHTKWLYSIYPSFAELAQPLHKVV